MKDCFTTILNAIIQLVFRLRRYARRRKLTRIQQSIVVHEILPCGDDAIYLCESNHLSYSIDVSNFRRSLFNYFVLLCADFELQFREHHNDSVFEVRFIDHKYVGIYTDYKDWFHEFESYIEERIGEL